jgi:hypothetical protein
MLRLLDPWPSAFWLLQEKAKARASELGFIFLSQTTLFE